MTQTTYHGFAFLNLSPEVGRYLKDYVSTDVLARTDQGKAQYPLWWVLSSDYIEVWTGIEGSGLSAARWPAWSFRWRSGCARRPRTRWPAG